MLGEASGWSDESSSSSCRRDLILFDLVRLAKIGVLDSMNELVSA